MDISFRAGQLSWKNKEEHKVEDKKEKRKDKMTKDSRTLESEKVGNMEF